MIAGEGFCREFVATSHSAIEVSEDSNTDLLGHAVGEAVPQMHDSAEATVDCRNSDGIETASGVSVVRLVPDMPPAHTADETRNSSYYIVVDCIAMVFAAGFVTAPARTAAGYMSVALAFVASLEPAVDTDFHTRLVGRRKLDGQKILEAFPGRLGTVRCAYCSFDFHTG